MKLPIKGPLLDLRQFSTTESLLKLMKNAFYVMSKAFFILEIFTILSWHFGYEGKRIAQKAKVNFIIYDVTDWATSNYNTHIAQYLKK